MLLWRGAGSDADQARAEQRRDGPLQLLGLERFADVTLRARNPIVALFGEPIDLSAFPAETRLAHHKKCADLFCARISALMAEERRIRAEASVASPARGRLGR